MFFRNSNQNRQFVKNKRDSRSHTKFKIKNEKKSKKYFSKLLSDSRHPVKTILTSIFKKIEEESKTVFQNSNQSLDNQSKLCEVVDTTLNSR